MIRGSRSFVILVVVVALAARVLKLSPIELIATDFGRHGGRRMLMHMLPLLANLFVLRPLLLAFKCLLFAGSSISGVHDFDGTSLSGVVGED